MRRILYLLSLLAFFGCGDGHQASSTVTQSAPTTNNSLQTEPAEKTYRILRESQAGNFKNADILIDSSKLEINQVAMSATMFKLTKCQQEPCNVVTVWDSEKAMRLYVNKQNGAAWRKKYWPFICEHYVADYFISVGELNLYPFMDSAYRQWGGKKKRPQEHSFSLP